MKFQKRALINIFKKSKIKIQLNFMYIITVFVPLVIVGIFFIFSSSRILLSYHTDLLEANNQRIRSIFFEISSQVYNTAEDIAFNSSTSKILSTQYKSTEEFRQIAAQYDVIDNYQTSYTGIEDIKIYTDNETMTDYRQFVMVTDSIASEDWYTKAISQFSPFWISFLREDAYKNKYWCLALVRKVTLAGSGVNAVEVITLSDNYLKTRIDTTDYTIMLSTKENRVFFSTISSYYGNEPPIAIDTSDPYFTFSGEFSKNNINNIGSVSSMTMYKSDSPLYIISYSSEAYTSMHRIIYVGAFIIIMALVLPAVLMRFFITYFTGQVNVIRGEMHKASREDYDIIINNFLGSYELTEAFDDLLVMVQKIKEKDARMFQDKIEEQQLINEQQAVEFKMLASQINPHFLYNTLETIRMKALTAGDRETASAIMLLGKSMRYVLDNTGTEYTTLAKELAHIEIYLQIQKLRFQDRVNYSLSVENGINLDEIKMLPLLLQPIVENAILHGLEEVEENGQIIVKIYRIDSDLHIDITDNGCGMNSLELEKLRKSINHPETDTLNKKRPRIGIYNINQRIKLCYGQKYGLVFYSEEGKGTTVSVIIPF